MEEHIRRVVGIRDVSERRGTLERAGLGEAEIAAVLEQAHFRTKGRDKFPRFVDEIPPKSIRLSG